MDSIKLEGIESQRVELINLIKKIGYIKGNFTLSSGKKSTFYIDIKTVSLNPSGAKLIGMLGFKTIKALNWKLSAIGGMTIGADPISTAISLNAINDDVFWPAFIIRKEPKGHGRNQYIEGLSNLEKNSKVVIIEDVLSSGRSALKAADKAKSAKLEVCGIWSVLDREMGAIEKISNSGFKVFSLTTLSEIKS